jgi:AcrR family transcriptional regulator
MVLREIRRLRARRAEKKREEILRAGLKVFAEKGFAGATMDDIALELEATKGLLYYHFKTKEELLQAILRAEPLTEGLERLFSGLAGLGLREALSTLAFHFAALLDEHRELVRFLHVQALLSRAEAEVVYTSVLERLYREGEKLLRRFQQAGEVRREVDCAVLARAVADLLIAHVIQGEIFGPQHRTGPGYLEQVVDVLVQGVSPRARGETRRNARTTQGGAG